MPYVNHNSGIGFALGISNWGSIKAAGTQLMTDCLKKEGSSGGEFFVRDSTSIGPVLAIYMWASGASFEASLNKYENDPTNNTPPTHAFPGGLSSNDTYKVAGAPSNVSTNGLPESTTASTVGGPSGDISIDTS